MRPHRPPLDNQNSEQSQNSAQSQPSRAALGRLLLASGLTIALSFVPVASQVLYPLRLFVTLIHEGSHALSSSAYISWDFAGCFSLRHGKKIPGFFCTTT